ncbi:hypothetical protein CLJ1_4604 [Pseudomonas paraeruginosa]|nr:hypothetical protein CLJ1_4604 [Pseudomonas aeruginosa]
MSRRRELNDAQANPDRRVAAGLRTGPGRGKAGCLSRRPAAGRAAASRAWLAIQASGQAASPVRQGATAAERERAYQRYLKSYEHEIPEYLLEDRGFGESKN